VTRIDQTLTSLPWKKLLLVDDECQSLKWEKVLQFILEPHGWMVESDDGSNPNRVLEKAPEFDVVLLDINLNGKEHDTESVPFCGGLKILSELKKRHLGFPIVMFTVESDIPLSEFCKGEGAMDYFVKKKSVRHEGGFSVSFEYYHDFISTLERAYALSLPFHYLEQLGGKLEAQTVVYLKEAMRWLGDARISLYFSSVFHETVLLLYGQWIGRRQIGEILAQIVHPPPYKQYAYLLWQVRNIIMHSEGITFRPTNTEAELVLIMASAFAQQLNNLAMTERLKEALNRKRRQVTLKFERNLREFLTQDVKRIDMDVFENWNDADRQEHWKALWDVPQALT
jgi:CheY-like chemotaxis protein